MTRFELATPATRTRCATKLRHIPTTILNFQTFNRGAVWVFFAKRLHRAFALHSPAPFKKVINLFSWATLPHPDNNIQFSTFNLNARFAPKRSHKNITTKKYFLKAYLIFFSKILIKSNSQYCSVVLSISIFSFILSKFKPKKE